MRKVKIEKWILDSGAIWWWIIDANNGEEIDGFKTKRMAIERAKIWGYQLIK